MQITLRKVVSALVRRNELQGHGVWIMVPAEGFSRKISVEVKLYYRIVAEFVHYKSVSCKTI